MNDETTEHEPCPEIVEYKARLRREREQESALWRSHLRSSHDPAPSNDWVQAALGAPARQVGEGALASWEMLAARAHHAHQVRPGGDHDGYGLDPDDLAEENRRLGTPDATSLGRIGR